MKKRILTCILTATLLLLTGCQSSEQPSSPSDAAPDQKELTKLTLNEVAHSIFYAPMYVAIEKDYFEEEGIKLDLVTGFGAV